MPIHSTTYTMDIFDYAAAFISGIRLGIVRTIDHLADR